MRNSAVLILGLGLLLAQGMFALVAPSDYLCPSLVLPLVLAMAVGEFTLARGVSLSFVMGYLTDASSGASMGLWTFTLVSVFLLARMAGLKLFLHGVVFQVLLTFVASMSAGVLMMGLLLVFDRRALAMGAALGLVASQSVWTAACAPAVFALVRRLPGNRPGADDE